MSLRIAALLLVLVPAVLAPAPAQAASSFLRCESVDYRDDYCPAETRRGVRLVRELSDTACVIGRNWGYDRGGVWVTAGCAAEFEIGNHGDGYGWGYGYNNDGYLSCESHDYEREHCRVNTRGSVVLVNQTSRSACIEGRSWGWDHSGVWVSDGCAGEFRIGDDGEVADHDDDAHDDGLSTGDTVVCRSRDRGRSYCLVDARGYDATLIRRIGDAPCVDGESWGSDRRGIWVANGCAAEFRITVSSRPHGVDDSANIVRCESRDNARSYCDVTGSRSVRLVRQVSGAPCIQGRSWDYNRRSIWVDDGCRADFEIRR